MNQEVLEARGLVLAEMVQQENTIAALRARVAKLEAAVPSDINNLDDVVRVLGIESDSITPAEKVEELFQTIEKLRDRNAALEGICRSAGLCMSCLYGAPDPIGCTDCLGAGWDGGSPYDQIKVLEARGAKLEAALTETQRFLRAAQRVSASARHALRIIDAALSETVEA